MEVLNANGSLIKGKIFQNEFASSKVFDMVEWKKLIENFSWDGLIISYTYTLKEQRKSELTNTCLKNGKQKPEPD